MRPLIAEIVGGERPEGEKLPREEDLATQHGVSRGVARECIRAMEERGLVSVRHGKGATVNPSDDWNVFDPEVLRAILNSPRSVEILAAYLECRRILEVEAAGLAAERATAKDLEYLSIALARMEESAAPSADSEAAEDLFHEADTAFHEALFRATGNRALGGLAETIHAALLAARYPLSRPQYRIERAMPEHRRIFAAVAERDPAAAREAMAAHLRTIEGYLQEHAKQLLDGSPAL
jgi:GntR family transcriptional repressor for pyruvate dehydrogenase complex